MRVLKAERSMRVDLALDSSLHLGLLTLHLRLHSQGDLELDRPGRITQDLLNSASATAMTLADKCMVACSTRRRTEDADLCMVQSTHGRGAAHTCFGRRNG